METYRGKVSGAGRVVLPADLRDHFGIAEGDEVVFEATDYGIRVTPLAQAVRQAQELVAKYVPPGVSLVDELIARRHAEAAGE